ncbi:MAG: hypothetical protein UX43_C0016G0008 [Candidatus Giovannonibacteria bacterium GW2011_GWB1_46_20]|nr:MAG: hypothetical protein UX43_C0016G0008 [Candidatus Giovannonibacteria bacterium GW2011_GWB1_46_20]
MVRFKNQLKIYLNANLEWKLLKNKKRRSSSLGGFMIIEFLFDFDFVPRNQSGFAANYFLQSFIHLQKH